MTAVAAGKQTFALLEREYYTSEEIFSKEFERIYAQEWVFAAHVSQLPSKGSFLKFEYGGEAIVVVRGEGDLFHAHLNVCRHRGFRLCEEDSGKVRAFVCPYHQWSYQLDGSLKNAPQMKDGDYFDYADYGLRTAHVEVWHGMIFINLKAGPVEPLRNQLVAFEETVAKFDPTHTKLAHEKKYDLKANWKVAAENSLECYHCPGTHRMLCRVVDVEGLQADLREWFSEDGNAPTDNGMSGMRIRSGMQTLSADGMLITDKLLGSCGPEDVAAGASGGVTVMPNLFYAVFYVDHWWTIAFRPISATETVVLYQWFVREDAEEGVDYDVERLIEVGHVTQSEDNALIERTHAGIESRYFTPGPIGSDLEPALHDFVSAYLAHMA